MAITQDDIKIMQSQVMLDVPEGGGTSSGTEVLDGVSNAIFEDISEADRAGGRVNLRKVHLHVQSTDVDTFLGSNIIISEPPDDPNVDITLFRASDTFDRNTKAKTTLESYYQKGPLWGGYLYGNHIAGMRAITLIQREIIDIPQIGKTLCLVYDEGKVTQREQYVRVLDVTVKLTSFVDGSANGVDLVFWRNIVTISLSDSLRYDFPGLDEPNRTDNYKGLSITTVRNTTVANAAKIYGCKPLTEAAAVGALSVNAGGVFAQIAPTATAEIPMLSRPVGKDVANMVQSGAPFTDSAWPLPAFGPNLTVALLSGVLPGTLSITRGGVQIADDSSGSVTVAGAERGAIDYATGVITFDGTMPESPAGNAQIEYTPAAQVVQVGHTEAVSVTAETRRTTYAQRIKPIPAPGTLTLSFQAMGAWYQLKDNGTGILSGASSTDGAGTISYITGDMLVTTGALPDAGSQVMLTWASPAHYQNMGGTTPDAPRFEIDIGGAVLGGSGGSALAVSWVSGGVTKTATWTGSGFAGDATGYLDQASGKVILTPASYPDQGTKITVTGGAPSATETAIKSGLSESGGFVTIALGEAIKPGTLTCEWTCISTVKSSGSVVRTRFY